MVDTGESYDGFPWYSKRRVEYVRKKDRDKDRELKSASRGFVHAFWIHKRTSMFWDAWIENRRL